MENLALGEINFAQKSVNLLANLKEFLLFALDVEKSFKCVLTSREKPIIVQENVIGTVQD